MEAECSSKALAAIYQATRCHMKSPKLNSVHEHQESHKQKPAPTRPAKQELPHSVNNSRVKLITA
jgi:hypothetical protein